MTQKLLKGYLIVIRAIRTISCKWSCGQRVALFCYVNMMISKTLNKNIKHEQTTYSEEEIRRLAKYFEILIKINDRIKLVKQPKCKTKKIQ